MSSAHKSRYKYAPCFSGTNHLFARVDNSRGQLLLVLCVEVIGFGSVSHFHGVRFMPGQIGGALDKVA